MNGSTFFQKSSQMRKKPPLPSLTKDKIQITRVCTVHHDVNGAAVELNRSQEISLKSMCFESQLSKCGSGHHGAHVKWETVPE